MNSNQEDRTKAYLDPVKAAESVERHFDETPEERIISQAGLLGRERSLVVTEPEGGQLQMFTPAPIQENLTGYLACALTDLNEEQRKLIFHVSDVISAVCREHSISLYEPRKATDPLLHANVSAQEVYAKDREKVLESDVVIHLLHFPSTGAGIELDLAHNAVLPIILIRRTGQRASRMVTGIPSLKVELEYSDVESLCHDLGRTLQSIKPVLAERRTLHAMSERNLVGDRIKELRELLNIKREDLGSALGLDADAIQRIEESSDRISNLSVLQLRRFALALSTTPAELITPDLSAVILKDIEAWLDGRLAARFPNMTEGDQKKVIRRFLLRVLDGLDK